MPNRESDVQEDVYIQFVRSLFESRHLLLIGATCHMLVALMAYFHTQESIYAVFSGVLFGVGVWRFIGLHRSREELEQLNIETAYKWEFDYIVKGSVQGLLLGSFCFVSIYVYPNSFAELGSVAVSLGSLVTVVGRNYGSQRMVLLFAVTLVGPISVALILRGDLANVVLGLLILPFIVIIVSIAAEVRKILFSAVVDRKKARRLAHRFDRALNTMSHGLVMLSPSGHVVVANAQAAEMLGFHSSEQLLGRTLKALLLRGVAGRLLSQNDFRYAEKQLAGALREGRGRKILLRLADGRHFEFSAREGKEDLGVLTFEEVTQRIEAEEQVRLMARYDSLTNLPNRGYFQELVSGLLATGDQERLCALALFDLDDFKSVNDTLGHPVGDGLIYAVGERLSSFIGDNIKIGRFGGDEFMIFFYSVENEADFDVQFGEIFAQLQGTVDIAGHVLGMQASAGAVIAPVHQGDVGAMIMKADLALYRAKEEGKNGWRLFETEMDEAFRKRQTLKSDLRSAIRANSLRVVFQPIVDMRSMRISGCEALCRWDHPDLGAISPSVFIPLAEEMGLVSDISTVVLEVACQECARWPAHLRVSVNLSAKDFYNGEIVDKIQRVLLKTDLHPSRLEIEVTETALLDDRTSARIYIQELKKLGIGIALDDFGTGYSSLSYLHTLPLDGVKIDGSFLRDIAHNSRSKKLLSGIVDMSRNLGLIVTIEGVERFEQLKFLEKSIQPDRVQGYLFGSALTSSGIKTMSDTVWTAARPFVRQEQAFKIEGAK